MIFLLILLIPLVALPTYSADTTVIRPNPGFIESSVGQSFTVNMTVTDVSNLNAWQLYILWNPGTLNCTQVQIPSGSIFQGYAYVFPTPEIDNTEGFLLAFCGLLETTGVNGSGILCQIEFSCKAPGLTPLIIGNKMQGPIGTYLQDSSLESIPFEGFDGMVQVTASGFNDYLFEAIQESQSYPVYIISNSTVTAFNYDQYTKILSFTATGTDYTNGLISIAFSKNLFTDFMAVFINQHATCYTTFQNETYNFLYFTYTHSSKQVKIFPTVIGDINGDRIVDMSDISIAIDAFLTEPGDPLWNPLADLVHDNIIDMGDISIIIQNFLVEWSP
jgi:hypothetical protein